jgi:hypothetical protein
MLQVRLQPGVDGRLAGERDQAAGDEEKRRDEDPLSQVARLYRV